MISFVINIVIALLWLLLSAEPSLGGLVVGYLLGFAFLFLFRGLLQSGGYVHRTIAFLRFLIIFAWEIVLSTVSVAGTVLFKPITALDPDFVELDVRELSRTEVLLLSQCITLTPGTTSVEVTSDFSRLTIHALDASDPDAVRASIAVKLRDPILAFTRPWKTS